MKYREFTTEAIANQFAADMRKLGQRALVMKLNANLWEVRHW